MKAKWGIDYDMHEDKCYKCPACPECGEPVYLYDDNNYHCVSCGIIVEIDEEMKGWFAKRSETKIEMGDCFPDGMGCGGKNCVEIHYRRNPVTLEWQTAFGHCTKCDMKFIV